MTTNSAINWMINKGESINGAVCFKGNVPARMGTQARAWFESKGAVARGSNAWSTLSIRENGTSFSLRSGCYRGTQNSVTFWATPISAEELAYEAMIEADRTVEVVSWWAE